MASPAGAAAPRKWTPAEDLRLRAECEQQLRQTGTVNDWMAVADKMPHRTNKDCRKRWSKVCATLKKGPWSSDEDSRLQQGVNRHGCKWTLVAQVVESRSADQCAKRWQHSLDPHLDRSEWKPEEDRLLLEAVRQYGQSWTSISEAKFPRRSKTDIKNRYSIILRRLKQRPSYLPTPTPDHEDDDDDASDFEVDRTSTTGLGASAQHINYHQSPSSHHNVPAVPYNHSMPDMMSCVPPYLTADYRTSSSSSSPPTPAWTQNMGMMDQSIGGRFGSSSRGSSSSEIYTPNDMNTMMDPMALGHDIAPNMTDEEFTSEMLAQVSCMDGQDLMSISGDPTSNSFSRSSSTLTITIEDADPNHIDGITSILLRSRTRFRMNHS
ncbi:hypothetical protein M409DRAFT_16193 [Zasmidium cellare ATCC 36951]|uniref:Uncharacterized protein n=1 Tax=Zasmidium cellare ATCC 36951 TaxID=1080233 RepID=A0A6A6D4E0_ZASCE|nr:uncharacterized protein M409DRAFT_16193 [Zasmidium cellare ATCC 36951]KAF2173925.1 hypothetical protein M409DRAFT_16193 [Zasmidium cellare ATCC 36951]